MAKRGCLRRVRFQALQAGLDLSTAQGSANPLGGSVLAAVDGACTGRVDVTSQELVSALAHALLLLHGDHVLLLGEGESEGHADEQG